MSESNRQAWRRGQRAAALQELSKDREWDVIVVGGGITGAGIYREAARLGLKVLLLEQQDFAWGTSSRSSKMVHGGLRYLGSGQFGLARDSVHERQKLMAELPGLVDPLPFMMAHYKGKFPGPWLFGKLLAIYDWMAGKRYRRTLTKGLRDFWAPGLNTADLQAISGFGDAVTDDSRLVMRVLQAGNDDGGIALNYLRADALIEEAGQVCGLVASDQLSAESLSLRARCVVNATGAWTDTLRQQLGKEQVIRPLRGSHLVLPFWRLPVGASFSFFHPQDKRPVFVFPWEGTTVIGTTDLDHNDDLNQEAAISDQEVAYLLDAANAQFPDAIVGREDVIATWSGVRPVVSRQQKSVNEKQTRHDPSDEKREHAIWQDKGMISVAGGKLTTYRLIAEEVLEKTGLSIAKELSPREFEGEGLYYDPRLSCSQQRRLLGRYGAQACADLQLSGNEDLQRVAATDTLWWELKWACINESVQHLDDLLLRRTRLGLLLPEGGSVLHDDLQTRCQQWLGWNDARWDEEWARYQKVVQRFYSLPGGGV